MYIDIIDIVSADEPSSTAPRDSSPRTTALAGPFVDMFPAYDLINQTPLSLSLKNLNVPALLFVSPQRAAAVTHGPQIEMFRFLLHSKYLNFPQIQPFQAALCIYNRFIYISVLGVMPELWPVSELKCEV